MNTAGRRRCAATSKVNQPPLRRWGCARYLRKHQYGKLERKTQLMFKRTDAAFDVNSVPVSRDGAVLKAGIDVAVNKNAVLSLGYGGQTTASTPA